MEKQTILNKRLGLHFRLMPVDVMFLDKSYDTVFICNPGGFNCGNRADIKLSGFKT